MNSFLHTANHTQKRRKKHTPTDPAEHETMNSTS
uniref:Uncharacterized protein n=1 Tax=Anguilla anguilla TaxID=7936 RepID=A0A0E9PQ35_ANGAN